jgi:thiosulfate/3-mercaptopyruvate sulfurtransferase
MRITTMNSALYRSKRVLTASLLLILTVMTGCSGDASADSTQQDLQSKDAPKNLAATDSGRREKMLVDRERLEGMLGKPGVRVVDARPIDEHLAAHIPGAVHVDVVKWQEKALSEGGLEDTQFWADEIGKLGVTPDTKVVVYGKPSSAARIWWHFAYAGVKQPMLLDGGWELWKVGGKPTEMDAVTVEPANFEPQFDKSLLMTKEHVQAALGESAGKLVVLDTRTTGEFTGREARGDRGGHIPGAVHCDFEEMLDVNGRLKSNDEIRKLFAERGAKPGDRIVTHCQSGGRASLELFALRMAGFENSANFYGGWSEWSKDPEAPIEK